MLSAVEELTQLTNEASNHNRIETAALRMRPILLSRSRVRRVFKSLYSATMANVLRQVPSGAELHDQVDVGSCFLNRVVQVGNRGYWK